jgi:hypothetical protein
MARLQLVKYMLPEAYQENMAGQKLLKKALNFLANIRPAWHKPGNTKGGSITVPLSSCLTGLD